MKKQTLRTLALILLCLAVFFAYRIWDSARTDRTAPEIHFSSERPVISVSGAAEEQLQGITATDDVDGDVTDSLVVEDIRMFDSDDGLAVITVAAFDRSGNVAKAQREVYYSDYHSPRFMLDRPLIFSTNSGVNVLNFITAYDVMDGDLTQYIRATSLADVEASEAGILDVEFKVTNSLDDVSEIVIPVEFVSAGTFEAELTLTDYIIYLNQGDSFREEDYLNEFILSRRPVSLKNGIPEQYQLQLSGSVDVNTPGTYSVSYLVTYSAPAANGSAAQRTYSAYSRLIVVVEG